MLRLAFLVLALAPAATAQLVAPSATPSLYTNSAIPVEAADASEQAMGLPTANKVNRRE
jgi:hypothetical protein